ncbi:MAG: hypothetical protein M0014_11390 [Actinomycetota bacterium]|nr:hypothetical protein [Actinomycetota bacterium]
MCRAVTCRRCGRKTWAGCGAHVEQVLAGVPRSERCQCETEAPSARGLFSRFGRRAKNAATNER